MTAHDLIVLLSNRHAGDVFVPQCKDGPTHSAKHIRLDAWVMRRSWSQWGMIGYETKVSRSDFLNDRKWRGYLPLCNELYFVASKGLIAVSELPDEVGLLEATTNGARLICRKKAPTREVAPPINLLSYILICRAKIVRDQEEDAVAYWRGWLEKKAESREVGYRVSQALRDRVDRAESEARIATSTVEAVRLVVEELRAHGIDVEAGSGWYAVRRVKDMLAGDKTGIAALRLAHDALGALIKMAGEP